MDAVTLFPIPNCALYASSEQNSCFTESRRKVVGGKGKRESQEKEEQEEEEEEVEERRAWKRCWEVNFDLLENTVPLPAPSVKH